MTQVRFRRLEDSGLRDASQCATQYFTMALSFPLVTGTILRAVGGGFYEAHLEEADASTLPPLVDTEGVPIEDEENERHMMCSLSGKLKKGRRTQAQPVSVGDRVRILPSLSYGGDARGRRFREGSIEEVLPRQRVLGRSRYSKTSQVAVANLDQILIVMAVRNPDLNTHRLDRFLVLAEASDLRAVICFNKIDTMKKRELKKEIAPIVKLYESLGYKCVLTSAETKTETGIDELRDELKDHISAFIGSSGVGKSTLVMAVQPDLELWVGEVMEIGKGRHTTTDVTLFPLDGGGYIADTPGIKTVSLLEQQEVNLPACFPEFREHSPQCRFNDCTHDHEPQCAVRTAVESGAIAEARYDSYRKMLKDEIL
ncbi:MAG: ribosome biosis GTPase / thiamine phosphate phosphatase [Abditibacteriota bacterium]|nr:ribosome biosis GTPase / thiamine phosphate phosphatase [Abditibacteriota bacterium]